MGLAEPDIRLVVDAVRASISLENIDLPGEFFPAHLSVALVDAVFRPGHGERAVAIVERYCHRFGVARIRTRHTGPPPAAKQETLSDLIRHFDAFGMEVMMDEVFGTRRCSPGTGATEAESVLGAARALRDVGLEYLQNVSRRRPEEIEDTLWPVLGVGGCTVRRLLMHTGREDFVRGDFHVRGFVARALGRRSVSASQAENLVRKAAYELILSPRFLDREIWKYGASAVGLLPCLEG